MINKVKLAGAFTTIAILAIAAYVAMTGVQVFGSSAGGSYTYHHYTSTSASSTVATVVKGGFGELGTITINSATATAPIGVYDGSGTATTSLDVIAVINASAPHGTYVYEVAVAKGVVVDFPAGFTGDVTVTTR